MKAYEGIQRTMLVPNMPVLGRFDGRSFHTLTQGMKNSSSRPPEHDQAESHSSPQSVDQPTRHRLHNRVGNQESRDYVCVLQIGETEFLANQRSNNGKTVAIDVADQSRSKEQAHNQPASRQGHSH